MATAVRASNKLANARFYGATRQTMISDHSPQMNEGGWTSEISEPRTQRSKSPLHQMRDRFQSKLQKEQLE